MKIVKAKSQRVAIIITIFIIVALTIGLIIVVPMFNDENKGNRELYKQELVSIVVNDKEVGKYGIEELKVLVKEENFTAIYDTSYTEPLEKTYTGIELKQIFLALKIDVDNITSVLFKASDSVQKIYAGSEIKKDKNVFLTYKVNGQKFNKGIDPLKGKTEYEDGGTMVIINKGDSTSQNRVKLLTTIEVNVRS